MRLIATAFTFGLCSISARGHAEPRVASAPPSHAKSATDSSERFSRFDSNRDGGFTVTELAKTLREQAFQRCRAIFARLDVDKDEALSAADADAARPTRVAKR